MNNAVLLFGFFIFLNYRPTTVRGWGSNSASASQPKLWDPHANVTGTLWPGGHEMSDGSLATPQPQRATQRWVIGSGRHLVYGVKAVEIAGLWGEAPVSSAEE